MAAPASSGRRRFLSGCTGALMALMTGAIFAPAVAFVTSPLWRRRGPGGAGDDFSDAGPMDSIPVGTWTLLPIEIVRQNGWDKTKQSRSVWVLANGATPADVTVLSPICPHLGCPITWSAGKSDFLCPCHGSIFSPTGSFVSGPSPRGMDSLEFQIRDGHLWVRWQDFRTGLNQRVALDV
jgi:menaquinol-cytochrome c reductase iron-sulfur subunit